jgi:hypothetical protein
LFTRWASQRRDTKVIGPGLGWWSRGRGEREGDRGWRILFGLFGGGVEAGQRYAVVFGARIRRGAAPAAKPKTARQLRRETRRSQRAAKATARRG